MKEGCKNTKKECDERFEFCSCMEPFAVGFLLAQHEDAEYKIASGMLERAKKMPLFLREGTYFAGWFDRAEKLV